MFVFLYTEWHNFLGKRRNYGNEERCAYWHLLDMVMTVCVWVWGRLCGCGRMLLFAVSVLGITFISSLCLLWVCKFKVNFVFSSSISAPFRSSSFPTDNKVQLVKGPKPLVYHRFYLDIEQHQIATKIETTIKQLGGVSMKNHCPLSYSSLTVRDRSIRPETENHRPTRHFSSKRRANALRSAKKGERERERVREKRTVKSCIERRENANRQGVSVCVCFYFQACEQWQINAKTQSKSHHESLVKNSFCCGLLRNCI